MRRWWLALALAAAPMAAGAEDDPNPQPRVINPAAIDDLTLAELTVCNGNEQWEAYLAAADEKAALAANPGVKLRGRTLQVGKARFVSKPINHETGAGVSYTLVGHYRALPLVVVSVWYFEGGGYTVVDPATGAKADLASLPLPSPGGLTLAGATRAANYDAPSIELVDFRDGRLSDIRIETPFPCGLRWSGDDRLDFEVSTQPQGKPPTTTAPAFVRREAGQWVYHPPGDAP